MYSWTNTDILIETDGLYIVTSQDLGSRFIFSEIGF